MRSISTRANLKRAFYVIVAYVIVSYGIRLFLSASRHIPGFGSTYQNDDSRGAGWIQYACEDVYRPNPADALPASGSHVEPLLFIGVLSGQANVQRRQALRETLFQHPLVVNKLILVK